MRTAEQVGEPGYVFVDNVRFWSMLSIVALHCAGGLDVQKQHALVTKMVLVTPFKFGTIGFFLISGFLMGNGLRTGQPGRYMNKRLKKIFVPWMRWFALTFLYMLIMNHVHTDPGFKLDHKELVELKKLLQRDMFQTPFWFVPNLLVGMYVLVMFRKHLDDVRLGAALLAINLFYVANIYGRWLPSGHQEAVLGFVFYLWLGGYAAQHYDRLRAWLARVPMTALVTMAVVAAGCAFGESLWMHRLGRAVIDNTLRLSNQVFSVLVVLALVKLKRPVWPRFVDVRRETFGLYLSHAIVLNVMLRGAQAVFGRAPHSW